MFTAENVCIDICWLCPGGEVMSGYAREAKRSSSLRALFAPDSVAVVGAARDRSKVGRVIFEGLAQDFPGRVYPINPSASNVGGHKAYPEIASVRKPIDLAVVAVPAAQVESAVEAAAKAGAGAAIVVSAGFKETGPGGAALENDLARTARSLGIRIVGPNCLGVMDTSTRLNASFAGDLPRTGGISFMSQSGALCTAILDWAKGEGVGFSKFVSLGNKADVSEIDLLPYLSDDPATKVVAMYIEGVANGREFIDAARTASAKKPVVALKAGTTGAGARAVSSHTGSLAGSQSAYEAAFAQAGIVRAETAQDLFEYAVGFGSQPVPKGRRLAIITNAGGPGIIAADEAERRGMWLAGLEKSTIDSLKAALPAAAGFYNPVDVLGDAFAARYDRALGAVIKDKNVDSVLVILTPQAMTEIADTARVILEQAAKEPGKPVYTAFMGGADIGQGTDLLRAGGIPDFNFPERAVAAADAMAAYRDRRGQHRPRIARYPVDRDGVAELFQAAGSYRYLVDDRALEVVRAYGIQIPATRVAETERVALEFAADIGYPVVLKVASPDVLHKSDIGAIKVGVADDLELRRAFGEIIHNVERFLPDAELRGVAVQQMVAGGKEVILGMNRDPQFGPLIMFGLGGIYVEVLKDLAFGLAPLSADEARAMVRRTKSYALLQGVRGEPKADIEALVDALVRLGQLVYDWPAIEELDINPLIVKEAGAGAIAADVRILLGVQS